MLHYSESTMLNLPKPLLLGVVDNPLELWETIDSFELNQNNLTKSSTNITRDDIINIRLKRFISRCLISWKVLKIEKSLVKSNYIQNNKYQKIILSNVETILTLNSQRFRICPNVIVSFNSRNWCVSAFSYSRTTITGLR